LSAPISVRSADTALRGCGIELDTSGLIHPCAGYGYLALGALLLAAAGAPPPWPIAANIVVFGAYTAHPSGPSFPVLALVARVATVAAASGHSLLYWLERSSSARLSGGGSDWSVACVVAPPRCGYCTPLMAGD
jgi:hypothetical protein